MTLGVIWLIVGSTWGQGLPTVSSPNGHVKVALSQTGMQTSLVLSDASNTSLTEIQLGLNTSTAAFTQLEYVSATAPKSITEDYVALHGKKSHVVNEANSITAVFRNTGGDQLEVEIRAYNDGLAFRYVLPDASGTTARTFTGEQTAYVMPNADHRWLQAYTPTYEGDFPYQATGGQQGAWGYPALFEQNGTFLLVTEANSNRMYCSTHLDNSSSSERYQIAFPYAWEGNGTGDVNPQWTGSWHSPWRVVICGQLKDIVESTLVEDVSDATTLTQLDFVQPGRAAWVYWAYNHGTKDYQICRQYVDLAVAMGWEYVLFDWEWDEMSNGGNLEDAVAYALSKGVKPLMWYNSGGSHNTVSSTPRDRMSTHTSRVQEFQWLKSIGVVGVKIDFFESDKQNIMDYYLDILDDAADYEMMVNFHGATVPRGWTRTYPHLISTEAVMGAEQYNNAGYMTDNGARVNCLLPYTRNVVGPMDYTPVAFTNSQHPHTTSYAHELALSVAFESGIQHWADRPEGFYALPDEARRHMMEVPARWDETRFINGYPGESFVVARRCGDRWYVAGLNGTDNSRTEQVSLNFLGEGQWVMTLLADGSSATNFNISHSTVTSSSQVSLQMLARGGFVLSFMRAATDILLPLIQEAEAALAEASSNIGTAPGQYDSETVNALETALNQARSLGNDATETQIANAYVTLSDALAKLRKGSCTQGSGVDAPSGMTYVTTTYLVESSGFARSDEPSNKEYPRFGRLAGSWVVTTNVRNQDNNTRGDFDSYGGGRYISLEKWEDGLPAITNGTICQTTRTALPAGTYHLELPTTEIWDTLSDGEIVLQVVSGNDFLTGTKLASYDMKARDNGQNSSRLSTCEFTLTDEALVTIGWLINIPAEHYRRSMRISAIYLYQGTTNVSGNYLDNYENIQRGDEPTSESYYRFGTPKYWTVENYRIDNGSDGIKQGIDNFPGYNCLQLGRWEENANQYNASDLTDASLYRLVTLPAGKYYFGAKYHYIETANIGNHAYLFAATAKPTSAAALEEQAFAFATLKTADTGDSFHGIEFTLQQETEVVLGWMMDATPQHSEFRCRQVTLLYEPLSDNTPIVYPISDGTYYLYNVKTDDFLDRDGNDVKTTFFGSPVTWTNTPSGATIKFNDSSNQNTYVGGRWYSTSNESEGNAIKWETILDNGAYKLKRIVAIDPTWEYLYVDASQRAASNGKNRGTNNGEGNFDDWDNARWQFMTEAKYQAYVTTINETDASAPAVTGQQKVELIRTLKGGQWNSFSVPFSFTVADSPLAGAAVKQFSSATDNVISFKDATTIEAGKPYVVKPAADIVNPRFRVVSVTNAEEAVYGDGPYKFAAHLYNTTLPTNGSVAYISNTDSSLRKLTSGGLKGLRSYFLIPTGNEVKPLVLDFDGDVTAIMDVEGNIIEGNIYNLAGQSSHLKKGIYIQNGKKVLVK